MRIGVEITPLAGQRSGVGQYTARLLAALLQETPEREYLLYVHRPLAALEPELGRARLLATRLPVGRWSRWLWIQCALPAIIRRTQPDICHFTNELAPFIHERPSVLTIHDASLFLHRRHHKRMHLLSRMALVPLVAHRATMVLTASAHARRDLIRVLRLAPEKVTVVHAAAAAHFQPVVDGNYLEAIRRQYGLPDKFFLYVGAVEPRKNLPCLLRALAQARRADCALPLVMAGPAGWRLDGLTQQIAQLGLKDAVLRLNYVPDADLPAIYSLATAFVYPSLYEGFGMPPLEAMACGTPVLTSDNSALGELYRGAAHLVDVQNEAMLCESLLQLAADAEWRAELRARGLERAEKFSWERSARATAAIYDRILGRAAQPQRIPPLTLAANGGNGHANREPGANGSNGHAHHTPDTERNTAYYNSIAPEYDEHLGRQPGDHRVRSAFQQLVAQTVPAGSGLLDFGCGTGTDALWFAQRGYRVVAYDSAPDMLGQLRRKCAAEIARGQITPYTASYADFLENLPQMPPADAVVANFAVFNLIADLRPLFRALARLPQPPAWLFANVVNPFFWKEMFRSHWWRQYWRGKHDGFIARRDWSTATYHHFIGRIEEQAAPWFTKQTQAGLGALVPHRSVTPAWHRLRSAAERLEARFGRSYPLANFGKYTFLVFRTNACEQTCDDGSWAATLSPSTQPSD